MCVLVAPKLVLILIMNSGASDRMGISCGLCRKLNCTTLVVLLQLCSNTDNVYNSLLVGDHVGIAGRRHSGLHSKKQL